MSDPVVRRKIIGSKFLRGTYTNGLGHGVRRPLFYEPLGLRHGTINIQLTVDTNASYTIPNQRVKGIDQFDDAENQDFLIRRCRLKEVEGYQVLPVDRTTGDPRGHHSSQILEISLFHDIELIPGETLEVELRDFED